jgi:hypothetical protein
LSVRRFSKGAWIRIQSCAKGAIWLIVFLICLLAIQPSIGIASTITIEPSKDASIFQNNVNNSSGAGNGLFAGTNGTSSPRRALIEFDIANNVPSGATITSVELTLFLGQVAGSGGGAPGGGTTTSTIDLHKLSADWGEGITQRQSPPNDNFAAQSQGAAANAGDATWNARFFPGTLWNNPGGDFAPLVSASATTGTLLNAGTTWGSTPAMVSDVQGWLDLPLANFGWILVNEDEINATTFRAYYSRDTATVAYHPELQISYTPPPTAGDINGDGHIDGADVKTMIDALGDLHAYQSSHGISDASLLSLFDVDRDHLVSNADLQALLGKINSESASVATAVPEPPMASLAAAGCLCSMGIFKANRRRPSARFA